MATSDQARQFVLDSFKSFGYNPSKEEIDQFVPIASAKLGAGERTTGSVANYVRAVKLEQERKGSDPLNQVIADERGFFTDTERKAAELQGQLNGPVKLFGGLDQNQIDQYLAPLSRSAAESGARLEGDAARRGIAGSSTEFQTLADNERRYRENVLSTGLTVGLSERDRISKQLEQQYGLLPGSLQRQAGVAGAQSEMAADSSRYISELPLYLRGISAQEDAVQQAIAAREAAARNASRSGTARLIGSGIGSIPGLVTGNPLLAIGGAQLGGNIGASFSGNDSSDSSSALYALAASKNYAPPPRTPLFVGGNTYTLPATADNGATYTG